MIRFLTPHVDHRAAGGWPREGVRGYHSLEFRPGAAEKSNHRGLGLHSIVPCPSFQPQTGLLVNHLFARNWEVGKLLGVAPPWGR